MRAVMVVFAVRAGAFRAFLMLAELLHLFLVECVELFKLFGGQDSGKGLHPVDAVLKQSLVGFKNLSLGGIDCLLVAAFKRCTERLFGFVLLLAEFPENGITFSAASFNSGLLFRRYLQQGIHGFRVHRSFEVLGAHAFGAVAFMTVLCTVRAMAGLSVLFARAGLTLYAIAGSTRGMHGAVFARCAAAFFAAGHFCLLAAAAATNVKVSQEKSQGEGKYCNACREEFVSVHCVTP